MWRLQTNVRLKLLEELIERHGLDDQLPFIIPVLRPLFDFRHLLAHGHALPVRLDQQPLTLRVQTVRRGQMEELGTNAQVSFFSSVLGEPPAMRRTVEGAMTRYDNTGNHYLEPRTWIECVWIDRDYYIHALADEDETIHAYSVTTRSKRFRPTFRQPGHWWIERGRLGRLLHLPQSKPNPEIKLGRTRFHKLGRPEQAASWIGARNIHYFEAYWGANPGLYQWFIYSINDAGYSGFDAGWDLEHMEAFSWGFPDDVMPDSQPALVQPAHGPKDAQAQGLGSSSNDSVADAAAAHESSLEKHSEEPHPSFYDAFRRNAKINTYTVLGPELALDDYPFFARLPEDPPTIFGPNSDRMRTLAGHRN